MALNALVQNRRQDYRVEVGVQKWPGTFFSVFVAAGRGKTQAYSLFVDRQTLITEPEPGVFIIDCPDPPAT